VKRRKSNKKSERTLCERFNILQQSLKRAEQENRVLKERLERAERAARTLRAENLAIERALPAPKRAARRPTIPLEDRWKLPKHQHWFNILDGIYKLLVKGAIPLNDPSITNKEIAGLLEEHDLLASPSQPRGNFRPVDLPRGQTLQRYVGETIAHSGRMFHAPELSKDKLRALTFAQLSERAAHVRSLQRK
jgi:transcriptional regulator with XRE-family HTH domain